LIVVKRDGINKRRQCQNDHIFLTTEIITQEFLPEKPKREKRKAPQKKSYSPSEDAWGIKVTKDSPDWLKDIVLKIA
jgi:hypothetical protein